MSLAKYLEAFFLLQISYIVCSLTIEVSSPLEKSLISGGSVSTTGGSVTGTVVVVVVVVVVALVVAFVILRDTFVVALVTGLVVG